MPKNVKLTPLDRLPFIVDKVTTSGKFQPDFDLIRELCLCCCADASISKCMFCLLLNQLQKQHAQIRLGVVNLVSNISQPNFIVKQLGDAIDKNVILRFSQTVRNTVLSDLQTWASLSLGMNSTDSTSLPPPSEAAKQLQISFINLLLDWEQDLQRGIISRDGTIPGVPAGSWKCTPVARGQFKAFLAFLRSSSVNSERLMSMQGLPEPPQLLRQIELNRARQQQQLALNRRREQRDTEKRVRQALKEVTESGEQIEENLNSLESCLKLLVPDPLDYDSHPSSAKADADSKEEHDFRAQGYLLGSSSGVGLSSTIQVELPCLERSPGGGLCVPIHLDEDTRVLHSPASEYAKLARDKHRTLLTHWVQVLQTTQSLDELRADLRSQITTKLPDVQQWLSRVDRLTHLFFDRIRFIDQSRPFPSTSYEMKEPTLVQNESTDDSDFEDVVPERNVETKIHTSSSASVTQHTRADKCTIPTDIDCEDASDMEPISQRKKPLPVDFPTKPTVVWRSNQSAHRFWRPIDPEEYEAPEEYLEDAISFPSFKPFSQIHDKREPRCIQTSSTSGETTAIITPRPKNLVCWAPLLSGRLCSRSDPSGRCPIHGCIVKRDMTSGRPISQSDVELLHAEVVSVQQATQEKRESRRKYPGLIDLNKPPDSSRKRIQSRVFNKRAVRRICDLLDTQDHQSIKERFSDNFIHAVKPR